MNSKLFMLILVIVGGGIAAGAILKPDNDTALAGSGKVQGDWVPAVKKEMGVVEVEVTPAQLTPGKEIMLTLALNNHSVDLDYEFEQISTLADDRGNDYALKKWTGNSGGHHVRGTLVFEPLKESSKELVLTLSGVDQATESFEFEL